MPMFVMLGNWTQKRRETIKDLPSDAKEGENVFKKYGVEPHELIFTMGRYDVVAILEAPDAESITKAIMDWNSRGLLKTETLRGFTSEDMPDLLKEIE